MYVDPINLRHEILILVKPLWDALPIIIVTPMADEFLLVAQG
jgi:hypothetical protein